ncbi:putative transporter component [Herbaspirillum sp. CF444]|uniref:YeeE/YedE family protein n=1 Tax=Herbaspirillum sp. CF444 TaxID=1144319 RepID=UPI0002723336|nr:YeeE/YedE family protein [Herbaspirillum sp. CF444]EJL94391.1 putative transporter component [Herbaspirillum sp. CF444]
MHIVTALVAGLIFGIGLIVSGMTDPAKVTGFLDLAGSWNPSLAFVMGGAILVGFPVFRFIGAKKKTLTGAPLRLPTDTRIDRRLIVGALLFGAGWGLAGYCPGPALASLATGGMKPVLFTVAMLAGMAIFEILERVAAARKRTN